MNLREDWVTVKLDVKSMRLLMRDLDDTFVLRLCLLSFVLGVLSTVLAAGLLALVVALVS